MSERQYDIVLAAMADKIATLETELMLAKYAKERLEAQLAEKNEK